MQTLAQPRTTSCHDEDWVLWIDTQVRLLSQKRFSELDVENLVEELDGMKKKEMRTLKNRLRILIIHGRPDTGSRLHTVAITPERCSSVAQRLERCWTCSVLPARA